MALVERELKEIQGLGSKAVSEINERTKAEEMRIKADSELVAAKIRAENQVLQSKLNAEG